MALRKFVYIDQTEGFSTEQGPNDELSLGKITFTGVGGVAIDGGGFLASNFASPVSPADLGTKSYIDAIATGLDLKASCRVKTPSTSDYSTWTAAGSGVGATLTSPDNTVGNNDFDGVTVALDDRVL